MKKQFIPIAIFLCFALLYVSISRLNNNSYLFLPIWDVEHYLSISETGYEVHPCTPGVDGPAGAICGNPGWFPMWPMVIKAIRPLLGGSSQLTFISLSFLFALVSFMLLFRFMEKHYGLKVAIMTVLALAFGPASFYLITGFPYALFILLIATYLLLLYNPSGIKRDLALFVIAIAISLTYPTGILVAAVPLVWFISSHKGNGFLPGTTRRWLYLIKYLIPFVLGPLVLWTYFYIEFDDFFLQLHFQEKYHRTWAIPFWVMLKSLFKQPIFSPENISILWYGLIFLVFLPYKVKAELWILALVTFLFSPTTGTTMSIYRHYLIILPAYMIIGSSNRPLWLKLIYVAVGLALALSVLFPQFMAYRLI